MSRTEKGDKCSHYLNYSVFKLSTVLIQKREEKLTIISICYIGLFCTVSYLKLRPAKQQKTSSF